MANLYVAEDGTIHERNTEHYRRTGVRSTVSNSRTNVTPSVSDERKAFFWIVTIIIAFLIGYFIYNTIAIQIFEIVKNPNELIDYLKNFFCIIAPFAIIGGALTGAIVYGKKCGSIHGYNLGTYFISALASTGGTVGAGVAILLLAYIIAAIIYIFIIAIIIAAIAGISGGD